MLKRIEVDINKGTLKCIYFQEILTKRGNVLDSTFIYFPLTLTAFITYETWGHAGISWVQMMLFT